MTSLFNFFCFYRSAAETGTSFNALLSQIFGTSLLMKSARHVKCPLETSKWHFDRKEFHLKDLESTRTIWKNFPLIEDLFLFRNTKLTEQLGLRNTSLRFFSLSLCFQTFNSTIRKILIVSSLLYFLNYYYSNVSLLNKQVLQNLIRLIAFIYFLNSWLRFEREFYKSGFNFKN